METAYANGDINGSILLSHHVRVTTHNISITIGSNLKISTVPDADDILIV